jgi:hypothetical protein
VSHQARGSIDEANQLGEAVARVLQQQGADKILASLNQTGHA